MGAGSGFGSLGGGGDLSPSMPFLNPVISYTNTPPGAPVTGDRYLINTAPTGAWVGKANQIAEWDGATWIYTIPVTGDYVFVTDSLLTYRFNGVTWAVSVGAALLQNGNTFGSAGVIMGTNDVAPVIIKYNNTYISKFNSESGNTVNYLYSDSSNYFKTSVTSTGSVGLEAIGSDSVYNYACTSGEYGLLRTLAGRVLLFTNGREFQLSGNPGGNEQFTLLSSGGIKMVTVQVGNAGLASTELYFDTAANILANGDLICARKV